MSYLRFQDEDESSVAGTVTSVLLGAVAGFAVGMLVAQRVGGFSGLANRMRRGVADGAAEESPGGPLVADDYADFGEDYEDDELESYTGEGTELEERVLEAFRNDPIMSERAVDIGGIGEETIELAGWVNTDEEAEHAVTIARGVPGVTTVVNRIAVGDEEERIRDHSRRFAAGDDALTEAHWEGRTVGTGKKRQGSSDDIDRHASPKVELAERWSSADVELMEAADETSGLAERRRRDKKPVKPGVPKADHVTDPADIQGV